MREGKDENLNKQLMFRVTEEEAVELKVALARTSTSLQRLMRGFVQSFVEDTLSSERPQTGHVNV